MNNSDFHLAQYNIIKLKDQLNAPIISEFKDFLGPVNQLADRSPGFVWRLKGEEGLDATDVFTPYEDPLVFINLSVWESFEDLENYVFKSVHSYFLKSRKKYGSKMDGQQGVLWWLPKGTLPSVEDAKLKLDRLNQNGSSSEAFSLKERYTHNGLRL